MRYLIREVAGWLLVALGLAIFLVVYDFTVESTRTFDAGILAVVGIFVFRGGIHLLKIAVAARICSQAQDRLYPQTPTGGGPRPANRK